jgi:hypothetical protein
LSDHHETERRKDKPNNQPTSHTQVRKTDSLEIDWVPVFRIEAFVFVRMNE